MEDVWGILWILIHGKGIIYDIEAGGDAIFALFGVDSYEMDNDQIDLCHYEGISPDLTLFVGALISSVLVPNR